MAKSDIILGSLFIIIVVVGLAFVYIERGNIKETLSKRCESEELTDWLKEGLGYRIECNGVIKNETCYIESKRYCAEKSKWGDCIDWERTPKDLNCYE